jgi:pyrimidine deaminase RibD-like protein
MLDPDPRNSGAGIKILRDAGITVVVGLLGEEAAKDLAGLLMSQPSRSTSLHSKQIFE